jgi:hypothetical protein
MGVFRGNPCIFLWRGLGRMELWGRSGRFGWIHKRVHWLLSWGSLIGGIGFWKCLRVNNSNWVQFWVIKCYFSLWGYTRHCYLLKESCKICQNICIEPVKNCFCQSIVLLLIINLVNPWSFILYPINHSVHKIQFPQIHKYQWVLHP